MYENQRHNVVALGRRRVSLIVADTKYTHTHVEGRKQQGQGGKSNVVSYPVLNKGHKWMCVSYHGRRPCS